MKFTEDTILQYLDDELSPEEKQLFEQELEANSALARQFKQYRLLHETLMNQPPTSPAAGFSERLMANIQAIPVNEMAFFNRSRRLVLLLIFLAIAATIFYSWVQFYPTLGPIIANQVTIRDFTLNLQPVQKVLSSELLFKVLLYVNGFISLLLFDRAILRPYFARRRQRHAM